MYWKTYIVVAHWKEQVKRLGLEWKTVRHNYEIIRRSARAFERELKAIRRETFTRCVKKDHPAFWRGDLDADAILGFDVFATDLAEQFPHLKKAGDPVQALYDICVMNESDFITSDNTAWQEAIRRTREEREAAAVRFHPSDFTEGAF